MRMELEKMLLTFHGSLLTQVAPALGADYNAGSVGVMSMGLYLAAQQYERGADTLTIDNRETRAIFGDAAAVVQDAELTVQLRAAANSVDASFRITELENNNNKLNELLIKLHVNIEEQSGAKARELERRILAHLKASAERQRLEFPAY